MSFVEGLGAIGAAAADPAFVVCVGGVLLLLSLLAGVPVLATALRLLRSDRGLGKFLVRLLHRRRVKE
jgi:hypothetical protein